MSSRRRTAPRQDRAARVAVARALVGSLDADALAAAAEVDRTLIAAALARSPLERVEFAQQMLRALMGFRRGLSDEARGR